MAHQVADGTAAGVRTNYRVIRYTARTAPTGEWDTGVHIRTAEVMLPPPGRAELPRSITRMLYPEAHRIPFDGASYAGI